MDTLRLARHAMATRFEVLLYGSNRVALRAAGEEALDEITRLEAQLSLFVPSSEIARVNSKAAYQAVRVSPPVFQLLEHARRLTEESGGVFDITIAPLMQCWGFQGGSGQLPDPAEVRAARLRVGMNLVHLDPEACTVKFERPGVMLDLGAIGKGYAIDRAAEILREAGVEHGLIHGGTSTVYGLGPPPDADTWKIEIPDPDTARNGPNEQRALSQTTDDSATLQAASRAAAHVPFAIAHLKDSSLSVSAVWGKCFRAEGKSFGHIIDPRSGEPAARAVLSAVVLPWATESDALSTALLTVGPGEHERIADLREGMKALVAGPNGSRWEVKSRGIELCCR